MPIKIIKKADAPRLPPADQVVKEPVCRYVPNDVRREGFEDIPTLHRCVECGELFKEPYWEGKPVSECPMWTHKQIKKEKEKRK